MTWRRRDDFLERELYEKKEQHSFGERNIIERLAQEGKSNQAIAGIVGRSESTIWRELNQLNDEVYRSDVAEKVAKKRRECGWKSQIPEKIWQEIFEFYNED